MLPLIKQRAEGRALIELLGFIEFIELGGNKRTHQVLDRWALILLNSSNPTDATNSITAAPVYGLNIRNRVVCSGGVRRPGWKDDRGYLSFSRF